MSDSIEVLRHMASNFAYAVRRDDLAGAADEIERLRARVAALAEVATTVEGGNMSEMVDRVARALWDLETETDCHNWDLLAQFRKDETYEKARAAIAAMREPTPEMLIKAGIAFAYIDRKLRVDRVDHTLVDPLGAAWEAAIDEALK